MLKSIFLKTIYEKRWATIGWVVAILATTVLVVVLFPTMRDSFGESLKNVPESLKSFIGDASDYQNIVGYSDIQVITQMIFMTVILGVILGSGSLAGDEGEGTLQTLLYQPTKRSRVYIEKLAAISLVMLLATIAVTGGIYLGALFIGEAGNLNFERIAQATLATWLITMVFGMLAFMIGAITGKRGLAGMIAGAVAFITYIVSSLAPTADVLKRLDYASPFHYFNHPSILKNGLELSDTLVLIAINIAMIILGYIIFVKRDIYQR